MKRIIYLVVFSVIVWVVGCGRGRETTPPRQLEAPSNLTAVPGLKEVTLKWEDNGNDAAEFEVERAVNSNLFENIVSVEFGQTTFTDKSVTTGNNYFYRVRAVNAEAQSDYSNVVVYTMKTLEPTEEERVFATIPIESGDYTSYIAFSDSLFVGQNLEISASFTTKNDLPENLISIAPPLSFTIAKSSVNLDAIDKETGTEIIVFPNIYENIEITDRTFAIVRIETLTGNDFEIELPYNPAYPEFPIEIYAAFLRLVEEEAGLSDPIRIHVFVVQENGSELETQVQNQKFGLFKLDLTQDFEQYRDDCESFKNFWKITSITAPENLGTKTPVVLIHGWQTLGNQESWFKTIGRDAHFTPYICGWLNLIAKLKEDDNRDLLMQYKFYTFSYDSDNRVADNAEKLSKAIKSVFPNTPPVIIAHSMGGLVASVAERENNASIQYIVSLGTPYRGTPFLRCRKLSIDGKQCDVVEINPEIRNRLKRRLDVFFAEIVRVTRFDGTKDLGFEVGLGTQCTWARRMATGLAAICEKEPNPSNSFLATLNLGSTPASERYYSIAGRQVKDEFKGNDKADHKNYNDIAQAMFNAYGYDSDGIVSVQSAVFSNPLSPDVLSTQLQHKIFDHDHHSALNGRDPDDNPEGHIPKDPLREVINILRSLPFLSGRVSSVPSGDWRATILYPSILANPQSIYQIGQSAAVDASGNFSLSLTDITPLTSDNRVQLTVVNPPQGAVVSPQGVRGAEFSLIVFNDVNNNGALDSGEDFHLLNDLDNSFNYSQYGNPLALQYADGDYTITGTSQTSTGTPVNWSVTASSGWGRRTFTQGGANITVQHSGDLTNLRLRLGTGFTPQALRLQQTTDNEFLLFW